MCKLNTFYKNDDSKMSNDVCDGVVYSSGYTKPVYKVIVVCGKIIQNKTMIDWYLVVDIVYDT